MTDSELQSLRQWAVTTSTAQHNEMTGERIVAIQVLHLIAAYDGLKELVESFQRDASV